MLIIMLSGATGAAQAWCLDFVRQAPIHLRCCNGDWALLIGDWDAPLAEHQILCTKRTTSHIAWGPRAHGGV